MTWNVRNSSRKFPTSYLAFLSQLVQKDHIGDLLGKAHNNVGKILTNDYGGRQAQMLLKSTE